MCILSYRNIRGESRTRVKVFQPQSKNETAAIRDWVQYPIKGFRHYNRIWLGFVKPRSCDGSGTFDNWVGQWTKHCEHTLMDQSIFKSGEPNNFNNTGEWCTMNIKGDGAYDVPCVHKPAYAVCEINVGEM
ncbi:uncharacterized protein LOC142348409 isoform X2 [Convolutriloba macropyga]|uniref:uncharacterized protein LOC142348409 isoform X2 n=1 Tax=Convolutriloba macropyga TaxID=536237 RepID=UPI003F51E3F9